MKESFYKDKTLQELFSSIVKYVEKSQSHFSKTLEARSSETMLKASEKIGVLRGRPLFYPYLGRGLGKGAFVELEDGSVKLNFIGGIGVHILGHSHPVVIKKSLEASVSDIVHQGHLQMNRELLEFQKKALELANRKGKFEGCWVTTSGSMANENALKICRQKTKNSTILTLKNAFAGRTTAMLSITENPAFKQGLPETEHPLKIPFFDKKNPKSKEESLSLLKELVSKNKVCCFVFEPLQGEGGILTAPRDFFLPLLDFCKEKKIPIWCDEIQTFARTGEFFAFEKLGLENYIDICTISKACQNGVTFWSKDMAPKGGILGGTFAGSSVSLKVGKAVLDYLDEGGFMGEGGKIEKLHQELKNMLEYLKEGSCKGLLDDISGEGIMVAFTPFSGNKEKRNKLIQVLYKNGLLCLGCGLDVARIRFLIPAVTTSSEMELAKSILEKSLKEVC